MRALTLRAFASLLVLLPAESQAADDLTVETERRDGALEVVCRATLEAPLELVWQTLTDYNRLAEFIPGMRSSRVVGQRGAVVIVEQSGEASFLFLSFPIDVALETTERAPHGIEVNMLKGSLKRLEGAYRIDPQAGGRMLLRWSGIIEPVQPMPPLIGELLLRASIENQFRGMVREIERRDALRRERATEPAR